MEAPFEISATILKVDAGLGLVFGWSIISKVKGVDYIDVQGHHIDEPAMLESGMEFMQNSRVAKAMHSGEEAGEVVFAFPLTTEIAKAFGITSEQTGLMIGMKPNAAMLQKFVSGEFLGFSIGGQIVESEEIA